MIYAARRMHERKLGERGWAGVDRAVFVSFVGGLVAFVGSLFVSEMLHQTHGEWSAPLDDVFIHFDYARSTARGFPFQWSEGNGYSSGNTSVTYPFALALGYLLSFTGASLMKWAVGVAGVAVFVYLLLVSRATSALGRWAKYLLPPLVLSMGGLDWSLASGMENAFHLGVFALAFAATRWIEDKTASAASRRRRAWLAGVLGALVVLTRPESVVCVAVFAGFAAWSVRRSRTAAFGLAARVAFPTAVALGIQGTVNEVLTGEWAQAGAVAKLAIFDPYLSGAAKWADYRQNLSYSVGRLIHYHFADVPCTPRTPYGAIPIVLALVPLADARVRRYAVSLWAMIAGWLLIVALNGQVRWQNERYLMAAVAWLMTLAAMGLAVLFSRFGKTVRARARWGVRTSVGGILGVLFLHHQIPHLRDQIWFYARASRNIRDQQTTAGLWIRDRFPKETRILVGDAGAITYASDMPGLDVIGLGGYEDLPFAAAYRSGVGATLELIERMPSDDRPELMAIYPSWWGDLPTLFGHAIHEVPAPGNVICGGPEKVIYETDWRAMDPVSRPRGLRDGERVVSEVDVGDLVSERAAHYVFPHPNGGQVSFRVLNDPADARLDLFDAGRSIRAGESESADFELPERGGRLVARTVSTSALRVHVKIDDSDVGDLDIVPTDAWLEAEIALPAGLPKRARVTLAPIGGDWVDYHLWLVQTP